MRVLQIGEVIHKRRLALRLTQEQLCEGICEPSTLSRIETGKCFPSKFRMDALLQRLDLPTQKYYALIGQDELIVQELENEIFQLCAQKQYEKALMLLPQLEKTEAAKEPLVQQFILFTKETVGYMDGKTRKSYPEDDALRLLSDAIRLTIPNLDMNSPTQHLLSFQEIRILIAIANEYSISSRTKEALNLYAQLTEYAKAHYLEEEEPARIITLLTYNYSRMLGLAGQPENAVKVSEVGRQVCIKYGHTHLLGELLTTQACCLHDLGKLGEGKEKLLEAFYVLKAMDKKGEISILQKYAAEAYHIRL